MQTQPVEDIDVILGRFQAWAGSQNARDAKLGIRELSCEEALRSSRYRWKGAGSASPKKKRGGEPVAVPAVSAERVKAVKKRAKQIRGGKHAAKTASVAKAKVAPEFRDALANAVRPSEMVLASAQPVALARQVVMSIRLAPSERDLIKTRAEEAGISASAYMRQCALEVEHLRQTVAVMEYRVAGPIQSAAPKPGFLARVMRRLFPRSAPSLMLRA